MSKISIHLTALGVTAGWHCLEVGGGGGSIARWLSQQVGPTRNVVATDLDTRFLADPSFAWMESLVMATWGRKPE